MQLKFVGTRGEIEMRTRRHRMHTSLMVSYRSANVMIDCGLDWLGKFQRLQNSGPWPPSEVSKCALRTME